MLSATITARQAYRYMLQILGGPLHQHLDNALSVYWSAGPVSYGRGRDGDLVPAAASNPASVWRSASDFILPSMDNADNQHRTLRQHTLLPARGTTFTSPPEPVLAGPAHAGEQLVHRRRGG